MTVWPVSSSWWTWKVGSSSASFWIAGELLLVALGLGLDGDLDHRIGERHRLQHDLVVRVASVSPVVVSFRPITA